MFSPAHKTHLSLTIEGMEHDFQVLGYSGEEVANRPYFYNLDLACDQPGLALERFLDREAYFSFDSRGKGIHGRIYHIARQGRCSTRYRLTLVPHLSYLRHRINQRIYQQFSVPEIVALILEEHGIVGDAYRFELSASYPTRDYCTQYDETDLHFIQRLCEEEGIRFCFQHSAQGHVLVFADGQAVLPWGVLYRPPVVHSKPRVPGNQTAVVIAVEEQPRQLARVKVQFPWDPDEQFDDKSRCWLPVAADWAREARHLRPGMQVLVSFLQNDPDQPQVSGCLCCR
ncbi:contractile injection system protein, VgrG/Pvc8 family [Pseudomonas xantholysinigenes]|uniref:Gp5/Type VI secretion system Vgr protein OB-fold domain-containing protein n=1 Tax=Pseudomonas xantholysinigenes TaxID=2745490 RepID=A0A9E6PSN8_9PSED|nr:contractile injection system protein, VgrG/Pvc8 family [Pseudomonas xantholysinigenes]QXI36872.1 hypothetical protein HU772_016125 [Pseudomonas xantholysinigenes]